MVIQRRIERVANSYYSVIGSKKNMPLSRVRMAATVANTSVKFRYFLL